MVSDLDIYRSANLLIKRYRADAPIEASRMVDRMLELDDTEGRAVWQRIFGARSVCARSKPFPPLGPPSASRGQDG